MEAPTTSFVGFRVLGSRVWGLGTPLLSTFDHTSRQNTRPASLSPSLSVCLSLPPSVSFSLSPSLSLCFSLSLLFVPPGSGERGRCGVNQFHDGKRRRSLNSELCLIFSRRSGFPVSGFGPLVSGFGFRAPGFIVFHAHIRTDCFPPQLRAEHFDMHRSRGALLLCLRLGGVVPTLYTPHPTSYTPHPALYTLHPTPYTLHPTPYTLHPTPCTLHPTPYTLHPISYTLHPTPYNLHPSPCILNPKPYTPHPTPYTLHPSSFTLHPRS